MSSSFRPEYRPVHPRQSRAARKQAGRISSTGSSRRKRFLRILFLGLGWLFLLAAAIRIAMIGLGTQPSQPAGGSSLPAPPAGPRIDLAGFNPGFLISDAVFYNYQTMDLAGIDAFIREKNAGCRAGASPCLADYQEDTKNVPASEFCQGYAGAPGESAATIIFKTAQSCQINPQVLLVLLQKEQGLITASDSRLTPARYEIATGFACPDGQNCDSQFFGFSTQVYYAAAQFQRYRLQPNRFQIRAGTKNNIAFAPNPNCGAVPIFVENQATAGLYNYTPYQPDQGVLSGAPGECSSYGNANFYGIFKAWFGDPCRK